jgi:hypothetical protein
MGQKMPSSPGRAADEPHEEAGAEGVPSWSRSETRRLVSRIAEALKVAPITLYEPPRPDGAMAAIPDDDLEGACEALLRAYRSIHDPAERRRLLIVVQEAAEGR